MATKKADDVVLFVRVPPRLMEALDALVERERRARSARRVTRADVAREILEEGAARRRRERATPEEIGRMVADMRRDRGLSVSAAAEIIGCTGPSLVRAESGRVPGPELFFKLRAFLVADPMVHRGEKPL